MNYKSLLISFVVSLLSIVYIGCDDEQGASSCMPKSQVNASYNLNLPLFNPLQFTGGYVELEPDGTNGSRGVIIVNTGTGVGYKAYDRNAPQICPSANSTLEVKESGLEVICPQDSATWLLLDGQPLNKATNGRPLYQFTVNREGNYLLLYN